MERIVPICHARTYRLVHPVIGLRKAIDGRSLTQSHQPLLDNAPSSDRVIIIIGIAVTWTEKEDELQTVRARDFDYLEDRVECSLIVGRFVRRADLGAPDVARKSVKRPLRLASGWTIQMSSRFDLE